MNNPKWNSIILFATALMGMFSYSCNKVQNLTLQSADQNIQAIKCTAGKTKTDFQAPASWQEIKRIFIVMLENTDARTAAVQPFLSSLAKKGASFTGFSALTHPSQPNYVGMISGDVEGVGGNAKTDLEGQHIGDLLELVGKKWRVYAEDYPGNCFQEMESGAYARRHVPFLSFKSVTGSPKECANIVPATQLSADIEKGELADFSLYIPNNINNGHDTGPAYADKWLAQKFNLYLKNPAFISGTLVMINYDESSVPSPNHIYPIFYGAGVKPGAVSSGCYDHYSILATTELILGLSDLGKKDRTAAVIGDIWN